VGKITRFGHLTAKLDLVAAAQAQSKPLPQCCADIIQPD
jgi:hypothetical protein